MDCRRSESESDKGDNEYDIADPKPGDLSMARLKLRESGVEDRTHYS